MFRPTSVHVEKAYLHVLVKHRETISISNVGLKLSPILCSRVLNKNIYISKALPRPFETNQSSYRQVKGCVLEQAQVRIRNKILSLLSAVPDPQGLPIFLDSARLMVSYPVSVTGLYGIKPLYAYGINTNIYNAIWCM